MSRLGSVILAGAALAIAVLATVLALVGGAKISPEDSDCIASILSWILWLVVIESVLIIGGIFALNRIAERANAWHDAYRHVDKVERDEAERAFRREVLEAVRRRDQLEDGALTYRARRRRRLRFGSR